MKLKTLLAFLAVILSATAIYAAASDLQVKDFYGPREILSGTLKLGLSNVSADSNLSIVLDNDRKDMEIISFLNKSNAAYSCIPSDCSSTFTASSPSTTKTTNNDYIALYIPNGKNVRISQISFNISSSYTAKSCGSIPVKMDILDDGTIDWQYMEPDDAPCEILNSSDTYDKNSAEPSYDIVSEQYCEKINIIPTKRVKLGADIVKGDVQVNLEMSISDGDNTATCSPGLNTGVQTCDVNFTVPVKGDYYVCIKSDSDDSDTMIKAETQPPSCGYFGNPPFDCKDSTIDYALYAQPFFFKPFTEKSTFDNYAFHDFSSDDIENYAQAYLEAKYKSDCSSGCVIPIKLISRQEVIFSNLTLKYASDIGAKTEKNFYSAAKKAAKVNMIEQQLQLEAAEFRLPAIYKNFSLEILLNNKQIAEKEISIEKIPVINSLTPLIAAAASSTKFIVYATSPKGNEITSYEWDFGDGASEETTANYVYHTYSVGGYNITVKAIDSEGLYNERRFSIVTGEPKEIVNSTIAEKKQNFETLKKEIDKTPLWSRSLFKDKVDMILIEAKLAEFELDIKKPDADFVSIKLGLDDFFVPSLISEENFETPMHSEVQSEYVAKMDNSEIKDKDSMNEKIKSWNDANIDINAVYSIKTAVEGALREDLITLYKITIKGKNSAAFDNIYLVIIPPTKDISFKSNYSEYDKQSLDSAYGFILSIDDRGKEIEFAVKGNHSADEFAIFTSPSLSMFNLEEGVVCGDNICDSTKGETYTICPADCSKPYGKAVGWIIFIAVTIGLGVFVIWRYYAAMYDKGLREKLFKPIDDFYKISFFIANEINKGKEEKEIKAELEKADWKNSQIEYAVQKVAEQTRAMQKKSILAYVQRELRANRPKDEIRTKLKESGWKPSLIDRAFKAAEKKK
jgi:PKD repeat protein